ncbi:MAG: (Fe-S)-binding protein [Candidatus Hydrothermarchaeaceae archaeon]
MRQDVMEISPMEIYRLLPKENCGECGYSTCMAFAVKMIKKETYLADCPPLKQPKYIQDMFELKKIAAEIMQAAETKLIINEELCNGCGNCVISCPPNVSVSLDASGGKGPKSEEVVMKIKDGKVVVINLKMCRRFEDDVDTRPCNICVESCPIEAIEFL